MESKTRIKICGLTRLEDITYVNEAKTEYIGFVFWPKSKRAVGDKQAAELKKSLDPSIQAVGVFVNETPERIIQLLKKQIIDLAQLHGEETEEQIERIRRETGKPVIKAVKIRTREDILAGIQTKADYLLLDSGMGSGETFDWNTIPQIEKPFFLAGGLYPGNVEEAVQNFHPYAVDVSSGVETDGKKDETKIREFIRRVRDEQR
ncbi:MAG: phosphoribosylanthranilate isomerase [Dorea sp.]|nr:phosphoribosylanthranilate isomerase [Dorea sp.]MDY2813669.1 phosphoribosylanthranilate isomerase [Dorea sp.]